MVDKQQKNGSMDIVNSILQHPTIKTHLETRLKNQTTTEFMDSSVSKKWIDFAKDDLASLLYPNICRTWSDSYNAFAYVKQVDTFSPFQKAAIQNIGSLAMYFAASKIKCKS